MSRILKNKALFKSKAFPVDPFFVLLKERLDKMGINQYFLSVLKVIEDNRDLELIYTCLNVSLGYNNGAYSEDCFRAIFRLRNDKRN